MVVWADSNPSTLLRSLKQFQKQLFYLAKSFPSQVVVRVLDVLFFLQQFQLFMADPK